MSSYDNPMDRSMEIQMSEAKRKAELYSRSLLQAREQEAGALKALEQERRKWSQSFEEKSLMVNQLERELQAAIDTIDVQKKTTSSQVPPPPPAVTFAATTKADFSILSDEAINTNFKNMLNYDSEVVKTQHKKNIDEEAWSEVLNQYKAQLSQARQDIKDLTKEKMDLTDRIMGISHDLATALNEKEMKQGVINELEGKLKFRQQQVRDYQDEKIQQENVEERWKAQSTEKDQIISALQSQLTTYENEIQSLHTKLTEIEQTNEEHKEQENEKYKQLQDVLLVKEKQIDHLELRLKDVEEKYTHELTETKQMMYSLQLRIRKGNSEPSSPSAGTATVTAAPSSLPFTHYQMNNGYAGTTIAPASSIAMMMDNNSSNNNNSNNTSMNNNTSSLMLSQIPLMHDPANINATGILPMPFDASYALSYANMNNVNNPNHYTNTMMNGSISATTPRSANVSVSSNTGGDTKKKKSIKKKSSSNSDSNGIASGSKKGTPSYATPKSSSGGGSSNNKQHKEVMNTPKRSNTPTRTTPASPSVSSSAMRKAQLPPQSQHNVSFPIPPAILTQLPQGNHQNTGIGLYPSSSTSPPPPSSFTTYAMQSPMISHHIPTTPRVSIDTTFNNNANNNNMHPFQTPSVVPTAANDENEDEEDGESAVSLDSTHSNHHHSHGHGHGRSAHATTLRHNASSSTKGSKSKKSHTTNNTTATKKATSTTTTTAKHNSMNSMSSLLKPTASSSSNVKKPTTTPSSFATSAANKKKRLTSR